MMKKTVAKTIATDKIMRIFVKEFRLENIHKEKEKRIKGNLRKVLEDYYENLNWKKRIQLKYI